MKPRLGVNVDHVATIRQARGTIYPDPVTAAAISELAGADQITVHLREDRRHIQDRDVQILRETVTTRLNLEMGATDEMCDIANAVKPDMITLVPERREEQTTEGGLDVAANVTALTEYVKRLEPSGAVISMFIDPEEAQVGASKQVGATVIELHTGDYATTRGDESYAAFEQRQNRELERLIAGATVASEAGLIVAAGHGLEYNNVGAVSAIELIEEFNIGHAIVARAIFVGFEQAVREMIDALWQGRSG